MTTGSPPLKSFDCCVNAFIADIVSAERIMGGSVRLGNIMFKKAWVQGVVVHRMDDNAKGVVIDDGTGLMEIALNSLLKKSPGTPIPSPGEYVCAQGYVCDITSTTIGVGCLPSPLQHSPNHLREGHFAEGGSTFDGPVLPHMPLRHMSGSQRSSTYLGEGPNAPRKRVLIAQRLVILQGSDVDAVWMLEVLDAKRHVYGATK